MEDKTSIFEVDTTKVKARPLGLLHTFYLSGDIEDAEEYIDWFDTIRNAGEGDIIKLHINSSGGDLFTAIQFMRVLSETEATVVASVEGACMSAATMIFLCAQQFEISEHSMFMFHNYSGMAIGKGGEMYDNITHERKWSEKILRNVYQNFLTEDEIISILDNKDIWMESDEVLKRLKLKSDIINGIISGKKVTNANAKPKQPAKPRTPRAKK